MFLLTVPVSWEDLGLLVPRIHWTELFWIALLFEEPGLGYLLVKKGGKYLVATVWLQEVHAVHNVADLLANVPKVRFRGQKWVASCTMILLITSVSPQGFQHVMGTSPAPRCAHLLEMAVGVWWEKWGWELSLEVKGVELELDLKS